MLDEDVHSAFEEVTKFRKKRKLKRFAGAFFATTLSAIVGVHWYFGVTTRDIKHELATYNARLFAKDTPVSLVDAQGKSHTISIIGDFPAGHDKMLKEVVATLASKIVDHTYTIRFVEKDKLKEETSAHAHLLYNGRNLCIYNKSPVDTWIHEWTHHGFFSIPIGEQIAFASINESFYRKKLIPIIDYPDRWAQRSNLPAGQNGPAFGFPSRYAAKHPYECASEMMEEIWRFAHPDLFNPSNKISAYVAIFSDPSAHYIEDHKQRYDILVKHGFLTEEMKEKMDEGFAGKFANPLSTD